MEAYERRVADSEALPESIDRSSPLSGRWSRHPVVEDDLRRTVPAKVRPIALGVQAVLGMMLVAHVLSYTILMAAFALWTIAFLTILSLADRKAVTATGADRRLLEDRDDADVCLVQVTIVMEGEVVGYDRGIAWFENARLLFSGHATSFALAGVDVVPKGERRPSYASSRSRSRPLGLDALPLRVPGRWGYVLFEPLQGVDVGDRPEVRFLKALYEFRRNPPKGGDGPRQWPPFEPWLGVE